MPLNKFKIKLSFGSAAGTYDNVAALQRTVADELLQAINAEIMRSAVLDIGSGTGYLSQALLQYKPAQLIALDLALPMLHVARNKLSPEKTVAYLCADVERLPLAGQSIDRAFSNLALQWCSNVRGVFTEIKRVLKPGGELVFSTFGPQTLHELKTAWAKVDSYAHVNEFLDEQQLAFYLQQAGFKNILLDSKLHTLQYNSVVDLMRELKGLGANNVLNGRKRQLTGKQLMQAMINAYRVQHDQDIIIATYEVIQVRAS